ncbi:M56 family metallopeptidase [Carboxylicivirga marina]|uniref:TonB-dependent receptor plug domain-containing protein n=1 Tax=Carboxylicivirga marina TaxID=2800988 RepID=A0ABS1HPU6_9BACT|nr:M56 family metallopeptidase [Carboxylicivirga marina]MBK3519635.1 TonB-dependent receptor plug domain-containing protein [Carboxylicivirga marina]
MDTFIELQLKTGGIIAVSVLLFVMLLAKDHFFNRNRAWLVATLIVPWIVPILAMPAWLKSILYKPEAAAETLVFNMDVPITYGESIVVPESINWLQVAVSIYMVVCLLLVVRLLWGYVFIHRLKKKGRHLSYKGYDVVLLKNKDVNPFSFFRTIYLPEHLERDLNRQMILEHERSHCAQLHSIDISLAEWLLIIQWWNPFVWWLRKLIAQNHEYCVDNAMVQITNEPQMYQYSLLNLLQGHKRMQLVNNFNQSLTKKRLVMMNKKHTNKIIGWAKGLIVLPLVVAALLAFTNPAKTIVKASVNAEINSEQDLRKHFAKRIKYPLDARNAGVESTVTVNFKVNKKGKVSNIGIGAKADATVLDNVVVVSYTSDNGTARVGDNSQEEFISLLEEEAKRVVEEMPTVNDELLKNKLLQIDFEFMLQDEKATLEMHPSPLIMVNGEKYLSGLETIPPDDIAELDVLKDEAAIHKYGKKAKDGAIEIITKSAQKEEVLLKSSNKVKVESYSINGNSKASPMFIVDGEKRAVNDVNSEDIETVTVLKDPEMTKLYGEGAENGVVLVTTKRKDEKVLFQTTNDAQVSISDFSVKGSNGKSPLFIVDGVKQTEAKVDAEDIDNVTVLKGETAIEKYGKDGENGVVLIQTKANTKVDEVVVVGYGKMNEFDSNNILVRRGEKAENVRINGFAGENKPYVILDGEEFSGSLDDLDANSIKSISVLKDKSATDLYGDKAEYGVIIIESKIQ